MLSSDKIIIVIYLLRLIKNFFYSWFCNIWYKLIWLFLSNFRSDVTEELTEEPSQEQEEGKKEDQQNKSKRKRKFDKYVSIPQLVSLLIIMIF